MAERLAAAGNLSRTDWDSVASLGPQIARDIEALRSHIRRQLAEIDRRFTPGARAETVDDLLDDQFLTETLALLLVSEDNHRLWQEIRLANVRLREPEHLADHLADAQASINAGIREDQALVDALGHAAGELLPPNPADGLSLIGNRQLAKAEVRLRDVMQWFADQRLLDADPSELHDRPGFRDSIGYLGSKGLDLAKAVPPTVSRIARRSDQTNRDDPEPVEDRDPAESPPGAQLGDEPR